MTAKRRLHGLRRQAVQGVAWSMAEAVGSRLITTVVFVILARVLDPADIGLVALALVFIALARLLVDQGFGAAIVQREDLTKRHLDTAFWTAVAMGIALGGGLWFAAGPISLLLDNPDLAPVLRALTLVVVIGAPSSTATAVLRRDFGFRRLAARRLVAAVAGGLAGVAAALTGFGVWSLVAQALVQTVVGTYMLWWVTPFRPGIQVSRAHFRDLFGFGNKVTGITLLNFVSKHSDDLLIGTVLGPLSLGLYSVAYRLLNIMTEVLTRAIELVALSAYSRLQDDIVRLRGAYESTVRTSAAVAAPAYLLVAVLAPDVINTFFGTKWAAAIPVMQALSVAGLAQALVASTHTVLLAVGQARTALRLSTAFAVVNVIGFVIAVQFGILAVAIAYTVRAFLLAPVSVLLARRVLHFTWGSWLRALVPSVSSALLVAGAVLAAREYLLQEMSSPVRLALALPVAGLLYVLLFRLMSPTQFRELLEHLRAARNRSDGGPGPTVQPAALAVDPGADGDLARAAAINPAGGRSGP